MKTLQPRPAAGLCFPLPGTLGTATCWRRQTADPGPLTNSHSNSNSNSNSTRLQQCRSSGFRAAQTSPFHHHHHHPRTSKRAPINKRKPNTRRRASGRTGPALIKRSVQEIEISFVRTSHTRARARVRALTLALRIEGLLPSSK